MNEPTDFVDSSAPWNCLAQRVRQQDWSPATLYVVATPIGNLGDMGLRAWYALAHCDVIAAEDTRTSRALLDAWGVTTPLIAAHRHNEAGAAKVILGRLAQGERVALISDAGAPAVSDPGARIVRAVRDAGFAVRPIPGPSAVIAALMGCGATSDENPAFVFAGFMPSRTQARQKWLQQWCAAPAPVVMFESPHRLQAAVADIVQVCGAERVLTIARELTKRFEQIVTMPAGQAIDWLDGDAHRHQGEFVLVVHQLERSESKDDIVDESTMQLLDALLETVSVRDAVRVAVKVSGLPRATVYAAALGRKQLGG